MRVLDHEPQTGFLLEHDETLILDVNCSLSFVNYTFMIELNEDEAKQYVKEGRAYIHHLADKIQYTAPIAAKSTSAYKGRDVSKRYSEEALKAVIQWRHSNP